MSLHYLLSNGYWFGWFGLYPQRRWIFQQPCSHILPFLDYLRLRLNIYGFKRTVLGKLKGAYTHSLFVRGKPQLCKRMVRRTHAKEGSSVGKVPAHQKHNMHIGRITPSRVSLTTPSRADLNTPSRAVSSEEYDPSLRTHRNARSETENGAHDDHKCCWPITRTSTEQDRGCSSHWEPLNPPRLEKIDSASIEAFEPPRLVATPCAMARNRSGEETSVSQDEQIMFPCKVHRMLHDAELEGFEHIISWVKKGRAFKIHDRSAFMEHVSPNYFDHSKYESFRRQLNMYSFHRVMSGYDRGEYSHPLFLRGRWDLCRQISRLGNPAVLAPHSEAKSLPSIPISTPVQTKRRPRVASSHDAIQFQVKPTISSSR